MNPQQPTPKGKGQRPTVKKATIAKGVEVSDVEKRAVDIVAPKKPRKPRSGRGKQNWLRVPFRAQPHMLHQIFFQYKMG